MASNLSTSLLFVEERKPYLCRPLPVAALEYLPGRGGKTAVNMFVFVCVKEDNEDTEDVRWRVIMMHIVYREAK